MKDDRRCFAQWFILALSYITTTFFATYYGLPQAIFRTDITYMTSVIAVIFMISVGYLGFASWRYRTRGWWNGNQREKIEARAFADIGLAHKASYIVTLFGLLGTVIGLQHQVAAMATVSPDNLMPFLATVSSALGTAFYATGCGIVASIGIIAMAANLEHAVESEQA